MTEKQAERLRLKIKKIKSDLAADKRRWGGYYDDSRGLRYRPLRFYIQLGDYKGGLRYLNWFYKNFPDDAGFPDFLFEATIILFYSEKYKEAKRKAFQTYCANTYLFDKFFGKPIIQINKYEGSNLAGIEFMVAFTYSDSQKNLAAFSVWLEDFISSAEFTEASQKFIEIYTRLKNENNIEERGQLLEKSRRLKNIFQ
ncbi:MAG: hypothetical protein JXR53_12795 [Bacteroidales bacterium]|nr:hypothetical protein [Bacteroidales bacterium]